MSEAPVSIHTQGPIRTITVQRPEKLNALNRQTLEALDAAFAEAATVDEYAWSSSPVPAPRHSSPAPTSRR